MTSLDKVRELNYDHHRRMAEAHKRNMNAGIQDEIVEADNRSYRTLLRIVPKNRKRILELGSASGGQWDLLREWHDSTVPCELHGIDLFAPAVRKAQEDGMLIQLGFVEDMGMFSASTFDLVCSRHVMEHLGDVDNGIREIIRVTCPGGYIAHVTPDLPGDDEPAHLNKWGLSRWTAKWISHGVQMLSADRYPYHGGEVHIVGRRIL
jgi:SAM-dependent methyltransferase